MLGAIAGDRHWWGNRFGKTAIARRIMAALPEESVLLLEQDHYYKDLPDLPFEERAKQNFDHPDSMDTLLLVDQLGRLRNGEAVKRPVYDFTSYRRLDQKVQLRPRPAIILEGILVFENQTVRDLMDIKIFVDTDADLRFIRRLQRDIEERGRSLESVIRQYQTTVRPMHLEFVEPSKRYADLIIPEGGHNNVGTDLVIQKIRSLLATAGS